MTWEFFSEAVGMQAGMTCFIPQELRPDAPVLYLLHGHSDGPSMWSRRSRAELYAEEYGMVMVMPFGARSFYIDEAVGFDWYTHVAHEVPAVVQRTLRLDADPSRTFIAGASMGGYGALRIALTEPERFAAAGSFSGAHYLTRRTGVHPALLTRITGEAGITPDKDLVHLARQAGEEAPPLFLSCGEEDDLLAETVDYAADLDELGLAHVLELKSGAHDWRSFDESLESFLGWLAQEGLVNREG